MTLVVAKKKSTVLSLVSDTGISLNNEQLGAAGQFPKICILNKTLAVGFSGSPDLAKTVIEAAPKQEGATYGAVTNHLLEAHLKYDHGVEFIVAFGPPLSKFALISGGEIIQNRTTEWIGDQAGFEAFQQFRQNRLTGLTFIDPMLTTGQQSEARLPTFDMIGSMRSIIERRNVPSVFGHPVAISNVDGAFGFRSYTVTLEEKQSFTMPNNVPPLVVLSQIAEAQQYSFSCFVNSPGDPVQAVAFHYLRGKITYVYHGNPGELLDKFTLYEGLNVIDLGKRIHQELGVNWIGSVSSRTGMPPDYGVPADQWRRMKPRK